MPLFYKFIALPNSQKFLKCLEMSCWFVTGHWSPFWIIWFISFNHCWPISGHSYIRWFTAGRFVGPGPQWAVEQRDYYDNCVCSLMPQYVIQTFLRIAQPQFPERSMKFAVPQTYTERNRINIVWYLQMPNTNWHFEILWKEVFYDWNISAYFLRALELSPRSFTHESIYLFYLIKAWWLKL